MDMLSAFLPVALLLASAFVYAGIAAGSNAYQITIGSNVSHLWETRERLAAMGGYAVLAFLPDLLHGRYLIGAISMVVGFAMACALFGLRFDVRLNLRRGLARDYVGTDPQTAAMDKQARVFGLSGKQYAMVKLGALLLCVVGLAMVRYPW